MLQNVWASLCRVTPTYMHFEEVRHSVKHTLSSRAVLPCLALFMIVLLPRLVNAETFVVPLVANGQVSDGTSYKTSVTVEAGAYSRTICEIRFAGFTFGPQITVRDNTTATPSSGSHIFTLARNGWQVLKTTGAQTYEAGYATLNCDNRLQTSFATFSLHDSLGRKIAEAPITINREGSTLEGVGTIVDQREGERVGLALFSQALRTYMYTVQVTDVQGRTVGQSSLSLAPNRPVTRFVDEFVSLPPGFIGRVRIYAADLLSGRFYSFALRFSGTSFTSLPVQDCGGVFNSDCREGQ